MPEQTWIHILTQTHPPTNAHVWKRVHGSGCMHVQRACEWAHVQCLPQSISETYEAKGKRHPSSKFEQTSRTHQHRGTLQYINAGGNSHFFIGAFVLSTNAFLLNHCIYHHHADAPSQVVSSCAFSTLELKLAALSRSTFNAFFCFVFVFGMSIVVWYCSGSCSTSLGSDYARFVKGRHKLVLLTVMLFYV